MPSNVNEKFILQDLISPAAYHDSRMFRLIFVLSVLFLPLATGLLTIPIGDYLSRHGDEIWQSVVSVVGKVPRVEYVVSELSKYGDEAYARSILSSYCLLMLLVLFWTILALFLSFSFHLKFSPHYQFSGSLSGLRRLAFIAMGFFVLTCYHFIIGFRDILAPYNHGRSRSLPNRSVFIYDTGFLEMLVISVCLMVILVGYITCAPPVSPRSTTPRNSGTNKY